MSRKLRICFFAPLDTIHTTRWLDHFESLGHEVYVFTYSNAGFRRWPFEEDSRGVLGHASTLLSPANSRASRFRVPRSVSPIIHRLRFFQAPLSLLRRAQRIRHYVAQISPDIVHGLWLWENAFNVWLTGVRPRVVTPWGTDILRISTIPGTKQLEVSVGLRFADAVTSGSKELLELCRARGAKTSCCHLIAAPGIDVGKFEKPVSRGVVEGFGTPLPDKAEIVLSCRAMLPFYRISTIVDAFRKVHQQRPQTVLLILNFLGDQQYLQQVKRQIDEAGLQSSVRLLDALSYDQMPELYAASSVMVSIPEADAVPQSAYEALAAGCPIVVSDLASYDGVIDDERTGLRVRGDDQEQVAQAILRILQDDSLRQRLVKNGRRVVREHGDIHGEMVKMEQLYYDLLVKFGRLS